MGESRKQGVVVPLFAGARARRAARATPGDAVRVAKLIADVERVNPAAAEALVLALEAIVCSTERDERSDGVKT